MLDSTSYVVEENLPKLLGTYESEEVNEYSTSQADLVIQKVQANPILQCCTVSINEEKCVSRLVAELKLNDKTLHPIWEFFHNMSAIGSYMAVKRLRQGIILRKVVV